MMRSFYASRYDQFIEALERYTVLRVKAAKRLEREVCFKATKIS